MAQAALSIIGGVVGSYFGPVGSIVGSSLGSFAGAELDNLIMSAGQSTPRLYDKKVQTSTYGNAITRGYGTFKTGCEMIWSTPMNAIEVTQGGGDLCGGGSQTAYQYQVSFAVGVCRGPIASFQRIWLDKKLVWDARQVASGYVNAEGATFHMYLGTDSQLPCPVIQAHLGTEIVPAFRDLAYIVFEHLSLVNFADHIPTCEVEVSMNGTDAYPLIKAQLNSGFGVHGSYYDPIRNVIWVYSPTPTPFADGSWAVISNLDGSVINEIDSGLPTPPGGGAAIGRNGNLYTQDYTQTFATLYQVDGNSLQVTGSLGVNNPTDGSNYDLIPYAQLIQQRQGYLIITGQEGIGDNPICIVDEGDANSKIVAAGGPQVMRFVAKYGSASTSEIVGNFYGGDFDADGNLWAVCISGGHFHLLQLSFTDNGLIGGSLQGDGPVGVNPISLLNDFDLTATAAFASTLTTPNIMYLPELDAMLVSNGPAVILFDMATLAITQTEFVLPYDVSNARSWQTGSQDGFLYGGGIGSYFFRFDPNGWEIAQEWDLSSFAPGGGDAIAYDGLFSKGSDSVWFNSTDGHLYELFLDRVAINLANVSDIVTDLCEQAGLTTGEIDVTSLTQQVTGYRVTRIGPVDQAIAPLATACFFEAVESDYKIKFVTMGATPTVTIPASDLSAHADRDKRPDALMEEWEDVESMPDKVQVKYSNQGRLYLDDIAEAKRFQFVSDAKDTHPIELNVVMTSTQARTIAAQWLGIKWVNRNNCTFILSRKYLNLDPTDVVYLEPVVDTLESAVTVKIKQMDYGANGIIKCLGVRDDPDAYTVQPIAGSLGFGSVGVDGGTATTGLPEIATSLFLLDIPALRDVDNDAGFYIAAGPTANQTGGQWTGCAVSRSVDAGANYSKLDTFLNGSIEGFCMTALATPRSWAEWDRVSTVTVRLNNGSIVSATELSVLNGANVALVGNEIIQFSTVTANSDGSYTLSDLIRGRRGSDLGTSTHVAGERFVVLSAGEVKDQVDDSAQIDAIYQYEAMGVGGGTTSPTPFANTAKRLWPYTVQDITGSRDMSSNLTIDWVRRTRINGEVSWRNGITEVPVSEASESYSIDIYDAGVVVRTLTSSSPTVEYTAADQTTDFGSAQSAVSVIIYQLSGIVGRGFGASATV